MKEGIFTDNGTSEAVRVSGAFTFHLSGSFGGGTVQLQFMDGSGTWRFLNPTIFAFTDLVDQRFEWVESTLFRCVLTGATAPNVFYKFGI